MTLASVAPAVRGRAHDSRAQLLDLAADMFEIAASDLTLEDGEIRSVDGTLRRPITDLREAGQRLGRRRAALAPNPDGMSVNTFGCQIAQVAVDPDTGGRRRADRRGARHRPGRQPDGRVPGEGGILQGIGYALMEERVVDPTTGAVVNAELDDYKCRRSPTCRRSCSSSSTPRPGLANTGLKGLGEPPIIPTAAAIGNALAHALGVRLARRRSRRGGSWRRCREVVAYTRPARRRGGGAAVRDVRGRWAAAPTCCRSSTAASARPSRRRPPGPS